MRRVGAPIALWLAFAALVAVLTSRVADWFVMTDELLYERLAISVGRLHSPLPHVHRELIGTIDQVYPLLIAPFFAGGSIGHDWTTAVAATTTRTPPIRTTGG